VVVEWKCRKLTCSAQIGDCRDKGRQRAQVLVKEGLVELFVWSQRRTCPLGGAASTAACAAVEKKKEE
jgi:hypothetical protein